MSNCYGFLYCFQGNYKDVLLKVIDPDNLPACYGGNQKDPDGNPRCITRVSQRTGASPVFTICHKLIVVGHGHAVLRVFVIHC